MHFGQFDPSFQQNFGSNPHVNRGVMNMLGNGGVGVPNFGP